MISGRMVHEYRLTEAPDVLVDAAGKLATIVAVQRDGTTILLTMPAAALETLRKGIGRAIALRDQASLGG